MAHNIVKCLFTATNKMIPSTKSRICPSCPKFSSGLGVSVFALRWPDVRRFDPEPYRIVSKCVYYTCQKEVATTRKRGLSLMLDTYYGEQCIKEIKRMVGHLTIRKIAFQSQLYCVKYIRVHVHIHIYARILCFVCHRPSICEYMYCKEYFGMKKMGVRI